MTYLITGGGSGGHIYPALAIADEIKTQNPKAKIILVGARRGMERKLFSQTSYKSYFLPVGQLHSSVGRLKQLLSLLFLPICFLQAFLILLIHRPKAVLGVGGYASGPVCLMARVLRKPTYIWDANATPGLTNRLLGKLNTIPLLVFPEASRFFKNNEPIMTGLPIRSEIEKPRSSVHSKAATEPDVVLIVGGSQGARIFNEVFPNLINKHSDKLKNYRFVHQTGLKNFDETQKKYKNLNLVEVRAYLDPIKDYYDSADLVVCRAGASTVVELSVMKKPSLLVPFPKASDDHQKGNALSMVKRGAALMIEEADFNVESVLERLLSLQENPDTLKSLSDACDSAFPLGARQKIAAIMLSHT